jgi:hypothetical protein
VHKGRIAASLDKLQPNKEDVIIVQTFDTGLYMAAPDEGGLLPPVKQLDGSYHIHGDLVLLTKDLQYDLFKQILSELEKWKENDTIFLAPLPRYLTDGCCTAPHHMQNRSAPDFATKLESGLYAARKNIKDFAFRHGYRRCSTVSTWGKVKRVKNIWTDPVHLTADGYDAIAAATIEAVTDINRKRSAQPPVGAPAAKKQKTVTSEATQQQHPSTRARSNRSRGCGNGRGYYHTYTDGYQLYPTPGRGANGAGFNNRGGWHGGWPRRGFGGRRGGNH